MSDLNFTLFETAIGRSAIVWGAGGIRRTLLPEAEAAETHRLVMKLFPASSEIEAEGDIAATIVAIRALLEGGREDLREAPLDMTGVEPFPARVYEALRRVGPGETITYGALATKVGADGEARAIGAILGRNPFPIIVPCHRVLAAGGKAGGFSAPGGVATKLVMLTRERARTADAPGLFDGIGLPLAAKRP
ncbi:methylated-DNA--[protein]-cysteine S-methyltransferase [Mesorhizobium sp. BR1-1-16]|uniref:methylated-DNA--[protein]-cysteine S-methyltransferase n=1 Tax=Mesorhizobium sp. BR1-1-16 TaxID=2876653 RepID=UPI001CCA07F0|nr:methylated-DNA--[protein]-cysteine S-methyltransferase [Mesorhizobium sp. BR1-1-16]MBZ9939339.1 methylated-DNA--[protein]-cysteine S-methyltransferase [Mesorhizobium sp. BR1-1-16]